MKQLLQDLVIPELMLFDLEKAFVHAVTYTNKKGKVVHRKAYTDKRIAKKKQAKDRVRTPWTKNKTYNEVKQELADKKAKLEEKLKEVRLHKRHLELTKEQERDKTIHGIPVDHGHHLDTHEKNLKAELENVHHKMMLHDNHHDLLKQKNEEQREKAKKKRAEKKAHAKKLDSEVKAKQSEEEIHKHIEDMPEKHVKTLAFHHGIKGNHDEKKQGLKEHYVNNHRIDKVLAHLKETKGPVVSDPKFLALLLAYHDAKNAGEKETAKQAARKYYFSNIGADVKEWSSYLKQRPVAPAEPEDDLPVFDEEKMKRLAEKDPYIAHEMKNFPAEVVFNTHVLEDSLMTAIYNEEQDVPPELLPDEESEAEKHQNRSDAMKGNDNAKKDGPEEEKKRRSRSEAMQGNQNAKKDIVDGEDRTHLERLGAWGEKIFSAKKFDFDGLSKDDLEGMELEKRYKKLSKKNLWKTPKGDAEWGKFIEENGIDPVVGYMIKMMHEKLPGKFTPKNFDNDAERERMSRYFTDVITGIRDVSVKAGKEGYTPDGYKKAVYGVIYDAFEKYLLDRGGQDMLDYHAKSIAERREDPSNFRLPQPYKYLFGKTDTYRQEKATETRARNSLDDWTVFSERDARRAINDRGFGTSRPWAIGTELVETKSGKLKLYFQDTNNNSYYSIPGKLEFDTAEQAEDWLKKRWTALDYYLTRSRDFRVKFDTEEEAQRYIDQNKHDRRIFRYGASPDGATGATYPRQITSGDDAGKWSVVYDVSYLEEKRTVLRYSRGLDNVLDENGEWYSFKTKLDAEAWLVDNYDSRVADLKKFYEAREDPHKARPILEAKHADRKGPEYLKDHPLLGKSGFEAVVGETFGLAGTDSGNWLTIPEQHTHQQKTYLALHDLADMLGLDPKAVGFDGQLKIGWGLAGQGRKNAAAAHFSSFDTFINLTKDHGAGSVAHEWTHALDDFIGNILENGGVSNGSSLKRTELAKAAENLMEVINYKRVATGTQHQRAFKELAIHVPALEGKLGGIREILMTSGKRPMTVSEESKFDNEIFKKIFETAQKGSTAGDKAKTGQPTYKPLVPIVNMYKEITGKKMPDRMLSEVEQQYEYVADLYKRTLMKDEPIYEKSVTKFADDAASLGQYWARGAEKLARAGEAYINDKLDASGRKNQYLVDGASANSKEYGFLQNSETSVDPYPSEIDRININEAFDRFFSAARKELGLKLDGKTKAEKDDYTAPREGDVKTVNGVVYVFMNHRWHRQSDIEEAYQERGKRDSSGGRKGKDPGKESEQREKAKIKLLQDVEEAQQKLKQAQERPEENVLDEDDPFGVKAFADKHEKIQRKLTENAYGLKEGVTLPNLSVVKELKFDKGSMYSKIVTETPNGQKHEMSAHEIALGALLMNDLEADINPADYPGIAVDFKKLITSDNSDLEEVAKKSRERYAMEKAQRQLKKMKSEGASDEEIEKFKQENIDQKEGAESGFSDGSGDGVDREGLQPYTEHGIKVAREQRSRLPERSYIPENLAGSLSLRPHQEDGVNLTLEAYNAGHKGFILADGTGAGKTRQQLAVAECQRNLNKSVLIVTEKDDIINDSFKKDAAEMGVEFVHINKDNPPSTFEKGKIYITPYNWIEKVNQTGHSFDQIIADECHNLKSYIPAKDGSEIDMSLSVDSADDDGKTVIGAAQAAHGMDLIRRCGNVLYCSATPLEKANNVGYITEALGLDYVSTMQDLGMEGQNIKSGLSKEDVFQRIGSFFDQLTEAGLMVKREVSMDNMDYHPIEIKLDSGQREEYEEAAYVADNLYKAAKVAESEGRLNANGKKVKAGLVAAQGMSKIRYLLEGIKTRQMVETLKDRLKDGNRQVVIFADSVNDSTDSVSGEVREGTIKRIERILKQEGIGFTSLHGSSSNSEKAVADFQDGKKRVIVASMSKGATGINLDDIKGDAPRTMLMMSPPFSANKLIQAYGRINRLTTKSRAECCLLFSDTEHEEWNRNILTDKLSTLGAAVEGDYKNVSIAKMDADSITDDAIKEAIAEGALVGVQEHHPMPTLDRYLETLDERKEGVSKYLFRLSDFANFIPKNDLGFTDFSQPMKNLVFKAGLYRGKKFSDLTRSEFKDLVEKFWGQIDDERLDMVNFEGGFKLQADRKKSATSLMKGLRRRTRSVIKVETSGIPEFMLMGLHG